MVLLVKTSVKFLMLNYTEHNCIYNVYSRLLYIHILISEWHISQSRLHEFTQTGCDLEGAIVVRRFQLLLKIINVRA